MASSSLPLYQYHPLVESSDSIRLLLLEPAAIHDDILRGRLVVRNLSSFEDDLNTHYAALSYVWGDPSRTNSIELVDGDEQFRHVLTKNLYEALKNIRLEHQAILIWADAICIDQSNAVERGHQVRLMGNVYRTAGCTVIYLGHLTPAIKHLFGATTQQPLAGQTDKLEPALHELCSREWFGRGCVFQELVLSSNPRVQCDRHRVGWKRLYSTIQRNLPSTSSGFTVRVMENARNYPEVQTFSQMVIARKGARVTDPRDYFFCLMGIASDRDTVQRFLPIDYELEVEDVFIKAAQFMANNQEGGLTSLIAHLDSDTNRFGLPSFVPTWGVSSMQATSHDNPKQFVNPPLNQDNIFGRSLIRSIEYDTIFPVIALSAVIPWERRSMNSFTESFESRVLNACALGTEEPFQLVEDLSQPSHAELADPSDGSFEVPLERIRRFFKEHVINQEEEGKKRKKEMQRDLDQAQHENYWLSFWWNSQVQDPIQMINSGEIEGVPKWTPALMEAIPVANFHKNMFSFLEKTTQDLHNSKDLVANDEIPQYRWAYCDDLIALVPPDIVGGVLIVKFGFDWIIVRSADHKLLQSEKDAVAKRLRSGYRSNPERKYNEAGVKDSKRLLTEDIPPELAIHYGEVKATPRACHQSPERNWKRKGLLSSYMVLI